jgi:hypothetical protein
MVAYTCNFIVQYHVAALACTAGKLGRENLQRSYLSCDFIYAAHINRLDTF